MFRQLFVVIAAIAFIAQVQGYNVGVARTMKSQLLMAGGKSQAEKKLTTGVIFKNLRDKLNKAAETPGFFDTGVKPEIDLYCKSNKDGTQIGDCPFAQFVQLVMLKKGIKYNIFPTLAENKPSWLKVILFTYLVTCSNSLINSLYHLLGKAWR